MAGIPACHAAAKLSGSLRRGEHGAAKWPRPLADMLADVLWRCLEREPAKRVVKMARISHLLMGARSQVGAATMDFLLPDTT